MKVKLSNAIALACATLVGVAGTGPVAATVVNFNDFSSIAGLTLRSCLEKESVLLQTVGDGQFKHSDPNPIFCGGDENLEILC